MNITTIGIDIAKNVFQLHGVDSKGKTVLRKRISQMKLAETMMQPSSLQTQFL